MRRIPMHMSDWIEKLDAFLTLNKREILTHAGRISHEMAKETAETEYEKFNRRQIRQKDRLDGDFEKTVKQLTNGKLGIRGHRTTLIEHCQLLLIRPLICPLPQA